MFSFAEETIDASQEIAYIAGLAALGALFSPLGAAVGAAFGWFGTDSAEKAEVIKDLEEELGTVQKTNEAMEGAAKAGGFLFENWLPISGIVLLLFILFWLIPAPKIKKEEEAEEKSNDEE